MANRVEGDRRHDGSGKSQQDGGARYADYGGTPMGIQNAADSLYALKRAVYDEGFCTADELVEALRADFAGHPALHARLLAILSRNR